MSLTVNGVWKAGVWATTVWADGVWKEGGVTPPVLDADTHDGVGGALIVYKRPHKKVHDEIEEYFDLRTAAEAEKVVDAIAEAANEAVGVKTREAEADLRHAKANVARLLDEKRNAELRALLELAQDEDDAEAVLLMLELS
jgi:hypothetical protein